MVDLEELERLANAATPGPWKMVLCDGGISSVVPGHFTYEDIRFTESAREAVPALIAEVRRLRSELDGANAEVVKLKDGWANIRSQLAAARLALEAVTEECMELRAHAAKVKPQCSCSRRLGDYCPDVDRACPLHGDAAKVSR